METKVYYGAMVAITIMQLLTLISINIWQMRRAKEAMYVATYAHFSRMFLEIMSNLPREESPPDVQKTRWWYRYWDMFTGEVHLHMRGYLDKAIFEVWAQELGRNFRKSPQGAEGMGTFEESHRKYMARLEGPKEIENFYSNFCACVDKVDSKRIEEIHRIIEDTYAIRKVSRLRRPFSRMRYFVRKHKSRKMSDHA